MLHVIKNRSITVPSFYVYVLALLSVDEILPLKYVKCFTNLKALACSILMKTHELCFI